jgi:hypothetical protein
MSSSTDGRPAPFRGEFIGDSGPASDTDFAASATGAKEGVAR